MCVTPKTFTINGIRKAIECRKCWQCKENRINDWVGRCIAESKDCVAATVVTLTYGYDDLVHTKGDDLAAKVLDYTDVEKWLKRLRKAGYPLRFFLCGEYGELKGRCHWHVICFWTERVPNYMHRVKEFKDKFWPHGYTFWDGEFDESSVGYVCRYVIKRDDPDVTDATLKQAELHMSRKPPLGVGYFEQRALMYAKQRLLPQDPFYSFAEVRDKKSGLPRKFYLKGPAKDYYLSALVFHWKRLYGEHPLDTSHSDYLLDWCDAQASRMTTDALDRRKSVPYPFMDVPGGCGSVRFDEKRNAYYTISHETGEILFWSYDSEGKRAWQSEIRTELQAERLRVASDQSRNPDAYRRGRDGLDIA